MKSQSAEWYGNTYNTTGDYPFATLASAYPFIAVPPAVWDVIENTLKQNDFVCFRTPYAQLSRCEVAATCDSIVDKFSDLILTFVDDDDVAYNVSIPAKIWLFQVDGAKTCESLISQTTEKQEAYILGTPFFRTYIVSLDYHEETIAVYNKTTDSPITPDDDNGGGGGGGNDDDDSSGGLGAGVIFAIVFAILLVLGGGCGLYYCSKKGGT